MIRGRPAVVGRAWVDRQRAGTGSPLLALRTWRPHRLRAVCRAPDPGAAQLASASAHACLAGIAAAPAAVHD
ncbi:hypothetical protein, partial [Erythrobacter donghaensis]|uniref:hypothetical protein n=1 Tax=Erythrobacter donghaensis TaxID=267135 RepID=UPI001E4E0A76